MTTAACSGTMACQPASPRRRRHPPHPRRSPASPRRRRPRAAGPPLWPPMRQLSPLPRLLPAPQLAPPAPRPRLWHARRPPRPRRPLRPLPPRPRQRQTCLPSCWARAPAPCLVSIVGGGLGWVCGSECVSRALPARPGGMPPPVLHAQLPLATNPTPCPPAPRPAGAFRAWCAEQMQGLTGSPDVTLCEFLLAVESNSEVAEYCTLYLGNSPAVSPAGRPLLPAAAAPAPAPDDDAALAHAALPCLALPRLAASPFDMPWPVRIGGLSRPAAPARAVLLLTCQPHPAHAPCRWPALPPSS